MTHSDFLLLAIAVAKESDVQGFPHTANAMRQTIDEFLTHSEIDIGAFSETARSDNAEGKH